MREKILSALFGVEVGIGAVVSIVGFYTQNWLTVALGASVAIVHVFEWALFSTLKKQ